MSQSAHVHNPFMLMLNPEFVLAAMEKSEHLGQLKRQLCRPLDRPAPGGARDDSDREGEAVVDHSASER